MQMVRRLARSLDYILLLGVEHVLHRKSCSVEHASVVSRSSSKVWGDRPRRKQSGGKVGNRDLDSGSC